MTAALTAGRPFAGTERQLLENTLQLHRSELVAAVAGLSDAQARLRLVTSLTPHLVAQALCYRGTHLVSTHPGRPVPPRLHRPCGRR